MYDGERTPLFWYSSDPNMASWTVPLIRGSGSVSANLSERALIREDIEDSVNFCSGGRNNKESGKCGVMHFETVFQNNN